MKWLYLPDYGDPVFVTAVDPTDNQGTKPLGTLQKLVKGWVEVVGSPVGDIWVNEEGLYQEGFAPNYEAQALAGSPAPLMGPAVLTGYDPTTGNTMPLDENTVRLLTASLTAQGFSTETVSPDQALAAREEAAALAVA